MDLVERRTAHEEVFRGRLLHAYRDRVRLPDGNGATREYIQHPGAVMIVPLLTAEDGTPGRVVLERQFRYPVDRTLIEFPAGKKDRGEDSLACARRELREETGYSAAEWACAGTLHPAVAYSTEGIDIWFARSLAGGAQDLDAGEFVEVFTASADELLGWCRDGGVTDAKTLAGALWLQNVLDGRWTLQWQALAPDDPGGSSA